MVEENISVPQYMIDIVIFYNNIYFYLINRWLVKLQSQVTEVKKFLNSSYNIDLINE